MVTPEVKREAVTYLRESFRVKLETALCLDSCKLYSGWYYKPQPDANEPIRKRFRELTDERNRCGGSGDRMNLLCREEGFLINHKCTEQLYREKKQYSRCQTAQKDGIRKSFSSANTGAEEP